MPCKQSYGGQYYRSYRPYKNYKSHKKMNSFGNILFISADFTGMEHVMYNNDSLLHLQVSEAATAKCSSK